MAKPEFTVELSITEREAELQCCSGHPIRLHGPKGTIVISGVDDDESVFTYVVYPEHKPEDYVPFKSWAVAASAALRMAEEEPRKTCRPTT